VQPANRGVAPAIAHSLLSISVIDPDAVVAVTPADHRYSNKAQLVHNFEVAFQLATEEPDLLVLMAARPDRPEVNYDWIETTGPAERDNKDLFRVRAFHEKPSAAMADRLFRRGSLWNTSVVVGQVRAFLSVIEAVRPDLIAPIRKMRLWSGKELEIGDHEYDRLPYCDFFLEILARCPERLTAFCHGSLGWSDPGDSTHIVAA
jgi:mannose-1-phosphate guanylyltransferase